MYIMTHKLEFGFVALSGHLNKPISKPPISLALYRPPPASAQVASETRNKRLEYRIEYVESNLKNNSSAENKKKTKATNSQKRSNKENDQKTSKTGPKKSKLKIAAWQRKHATRAKGDLVGEVDGQSASVVREGPMSAEQQLPQVAEAEKA